MPSARQARPERGSAHAPTHSGQNMFWPGVGRMRPTHRNNAKVAIAPRTAPRLSFAMANIHSQKKRILRSERERLENRRYTSKIKTYFRRLERAVATGEEEGADSEHRALVQTIDKAVKRGALHRNTGARKKSRAARIRHGAAG
jgi:small subunit ribosomal protein S20